MLAGYINPFFLEKDVIPAKKILILLCSNRFKYFMMICTLNTGMEVHVRIKNIVKVSKKNSDIGDAVLMSLLPTRNKVYRAVWLYLLLN